MDFAPLLQNLLNGISLGSVYAIFALGYTLVFSILGIINFAHGAVFTLGAYLTYSLAVGQFGINGLLAGYNGSVSPLLSPGPAAGFALLRSCRGPGGAPGLPPPAHPRR